MNQVHELDAARLYEQGQKLPDMSGKERKVAHNTWIRHEGLNVVVRYHATDIAIIHGSCGVTVNSGGWETPTTKTRLNALLPGNVVISQKDHRWYFWKMVDGEKVQTPFISYSTVYPTGNVWFGKERIL